MVVVQSGAILKIVYARLCDTLLECAGKHKMEYQCLVCTRLAQIAFQNSERGNCSRIARNEEELRRNMDFHEIRGVSVNSQHVTVRITGYDIMCTTGWLNYGVRESCRCCRCVVESVATL